MKKQIFAFICISATLFSCSVTKTNTSKTMDIYGAGVIQRPVIAELEVKEIKVTGTASTNQKISIDQIKQDAVADALKKANADVLIEPKYSTETIGNKTTATVTGFPGTYKSFKSAKNEDIEYMKIGLLQKAEVNEPEQVKKKKKGILVGTILGIAVAAAALSGAL